MNVEIKGNLAKLMATENLIIEHKQVNTASFNIDTRTLVLPMWNVSNDVYDLLVGHEVGHALYTPIDYINQQFDIPQSYLNIVEDARIEKLIKRKFPGISHNFYSGYQELYKNNFFDTNERDISKLLLIDRINLSFKIGIHVNTIIPFTEKEKEFVKLVESTETFQDVIYAAKKIYEYSKNNELKDKSSSYTNSPNSSNYKDNLDKNTNSSDEMNEDEMNEDDMNEDDMNELDKNTNSMNNESNNNLESITDKSLNEFYENIIDPNLKETSYVEIPNFNLNNIIISNNDIHNLFDKTWTKNSTENINIIKLNYTDYKNKNYKEVKYLVKEFEMKKSADKYAKTTISKTGILNTTKIHSYKWNEDIFKKINVTPDEKNHGLIFIFDWSSSMINTLLETAKQLINLIWFCNRTQIPFDVYCFVNNELDRIEYTEHHELKSNQIYIDKHFKLLNILSSSSKINIETQLFNFWKVIHSILYRYDYNSLKTPDLFALSSTPLLESIIVLHKIIPSFKSKTKCQKLSVIILTDGEANVISRLKDTSNIIKSKSGSIFGSTIVGTKLRDNSTGRIYSTFTDNNQTKILLESITDKFPDVNLIGIRLVNYDTEFNTIYRQTSNYNNHDSDHKLWKKNKYFEILDNGYKILYLISSNNLSSTIDDLTYSDINTKTLKNSFIKMQKSKTVNKKLLSSFVKLIS